jgi:anti-sigma regulatory factor (Ser/Thr protein kinase)
VAVIFSERYPASAASVRMARHDVIDALTAAGFSEADLQSRVALALSEATGNVVRHAYPKPGNEHMEIAVNHAAGAIVITVTDHGVGMDGRSGRPGMGLGLEMMRAQTTHVEIESHPSGTVIALRFESG